MPPPQHTVSIAFVRGAVQRLGARRRQAALQRAGIAPELLAADAARVPAAAFAALWLAVGEALDDEFFGLDSRRMKVGSFALLCRALMGGQGGQGTVERALRQALRGFALFLDDIGATLSADGGEAVLAIDNRIAGADARRFADETLLVMLHGLLCWLAGRRVPLSRLDWGHPRPPHADEYRRMFSSRVSFDHAATVARFDARVLAATAAVTPATLQVFLRQAPQSVFLKQVHQGGWAERVRRQLRRDLVQPVAEPLTLDALARQFALSPATLRRRLDDEGAGWQALKDEVRRDLAIHRLADPSVSIEDIAAQMGFNDASSFHRAFRKWTGAAPGAYRPG
jgi:AraC-like DNA-binding protein